MSMVLLVIVAFVVFVGLCGAIDLLYKTGLFIFFLTPFLFGLKLARLHQSNAWCFQLFSTM